MAAIFLALSRNARAFDKSALASVYFRNVRVHIYTRGFLNDVIFSPVALYTLADTMTGHVPGHCPKIHPTPQINPFASFCL